MRETRVPPERWDTWVHNFVSSHGETSYEVADGDLRGTAADGSWFRARLPFGRDLTGPPDPGEVRRASAPPEDWGVLLVRKGGFAVARLHEDAMVEHKVGQRHVQGRTKAGGQSQQRFARRRENQARQAYAAAADHAARILSGLRGALVTGGDAPAVDQVLADPRLRAAAEHRVVDEHLGEVPDPRRSALDAAVVAARAVHVTVHNA